jgi:hypothetical protein
MRYLNVTLKVELMAGTDIADACFDLCELANRVGWMVEAKFNDVCLWAHPGDNPVKLVDAYHVELKSKSRIKIAQC